MPAWEEDFIAALRAAIVTQWPEVANNGIWEGEHAAMIPWADLGAPYAACVWKPAGDPTTGGLGNLSWRFSLDIYYVVEIDGPSANLRPKLEALAAYLFANDIGPGQIADVLAMRHDLDVPSNQVMLEKNQTYRAGLVTFDVVVG